MANVGIPRQFPKEKKGELREGMEGKIKVSLNTNIKMDAILSIFGPDKWAKLLLDSHLEADNLTAINIFAVQFIQDLWE